jgi:isopentenyl-diphosphate delta-isomerase
MNKKTENRKASHLRICLDEEVQARGIQSGLRDISFIHRALPEIDKDDIDLSTVFLKRKLQAPIFLSAMTGGAREAEQINVVLAETAQKMGLAMGVGSQRAAIENQSLARTFQVARSVAPNIPLVGNLGAPQLRSGWGVKEAVEAVDMIEADALAIHLNPLQEVVQPEGEPRYRGVLDVIRDIKEGLSVPLIVKETGAGISREDAKLLEEAGIDILDVGGAGGTSWAAVEYYRAKESGDTVGARLGTVFWDWGIPTAASIVECVRTTSLPIIASGGIRSGLDIAKALALGADWVGIALPLLKAAAKGEEELHLEIEMILNELRCTMFLTGAKNLKELKETPLIVGGSLADRLVARGYSVDDLGRRVSDV